MPRAIWTGSITVGLLDIPVRLTPAVRRKGIAFNQVDAITGSRIRYQKVVEATDEVIDSGRIVKGVDLGGGRWVLVDDEELAALRPAKTKEIAVDRFVPAEQIPPLMYDAGYLLMPGKVAKPYKLLAAALAETGRVAVGKFVMRQKEYLVALRSDGEHLTLNTLVFPDEVVEPAELEELADLAPPALSDRELAMAGTLVEAMTDRFDPAQFTDTYTAAVMELIEAKAEGRQLTPSIAPRQAQVVDLASALEASVEAAKASRARHPTARDPAKAAAPRRRKTA